MRKSATIVESLGSRTGNVLLSWLMLIVAGVMWEVVSRAWQSFFFPPVSVILSRAVELWISADATQLFLTESFWGDFNPSLVRTLSGWSLALMIGISVGTLLGKHPAVSNFAEPPLHFMRAMPAVAVIPLFIILFGLGHEMRIAIIAFGSIWPVLLNTIDGMRSIDRIQVDTGLVFHISPIRRWIYIYLPAAAPKIFAGMRVSLAIALTLMVVSEMFAGGGGGLGVSVLQAQRSFKVADMWAGILVIGILGYSLNKLLEFIEARVVHWQQTLAS